MKKRIVPLMLIACLTLVFGLTGCGSNPYSSYDLSEYVKTANYKGLEMEKIEESVSDEEVDAQVETNVENTKTTEKVKTGKVAKNNKVNIDYEGKIDGKTFDGGSATGTDLTIGSGQFIDGFEDGLIGKAVGSTQTLNLKFPDDYSSEDLAGKDVVFTVKINYISKDVIPTYNDAWVAENSDVKTTAEYEKQVKQQLLEDKEAQAKSNTISSLWTEVVDNSEVIKYPEDEVNAYIEIIEKQVQAQADMYGMDLKDFREQLGFETEEEYNQETKKAAEEAVKEMLVMYDIAEKEEISSTKEDEDALRKEIEAAYDEDTFETYYGQDMDTYIEQAAVLQNVQNFIFDHAKVAGEETKVTQATEATEATKATEAESQTTEKEPSPEEDMSQQDDEGADDATSNQEPGGADA